METSQLICSANQLTGFYMMATLAFNELNNINYLVQLITQIMLNVISKFYYLILYTVELIFHLSWDSVISNFCITCSYDRKVIEKN